MGFGVTEIAVGKDAFSLLVENVCDATGEESKGCLGDTEIGPDGIPLVGEDAKGESLLLGEFLLGFDALSRNSDNIGSVGLADLVDAFVEAIGLLGASGGRVGGVKVDNQRLLERGSLDGLSVLVGQRKVGGGLTDGEVEG